MNNNTLKIVTKDPIAAQIHTLANGLKIYLSVNKDAPRIQTLIAVKAGSKNDPADATGLAHYLEHMMFKGTSKIGSLDWEKEKVLLQQIANLYEKHRFAKVEERAAIYKEIDRISGLAAAYVAPSEYDKMASSLGAKGTNAFTSLDRTVYLNDIPSNEFEKWLKLESERFSELVLRLFHTELETVYEEYNMVYSKDGRRVFSAFMKGLLPNHPYGTQTTIGTGEHLKTPSMYKIQEFFSSYYVPNNMAIILSGDFEPDEVVKLVEKYWGHLPYKELPTWSDIPNIPINNTPRITVLGKEKAYLQMGWKLDGFFSEEALKAQLVGKILYNQKAGLIDLNLVQQQLVGQSSAAGSWSANDYSFFFLYGEPRTGQSLEEVQTYLCKELEKIAQGQFEDWLLEAILNNLEYSELKALSSNNSRAYGMLDAFCYNVNWEDYRQKIDRLRAISKQDLIDFAAEKLQLLSSFSVFKEEGIDDSIIAVAKPEITPIKLEREAVSNFKKSFDKLESPRQEPVFLDYNKLITTQSLDSGVVLDYIHNEQHPTFELAYIIEMGTSSDNLLPIALKYLRFLGTDQYSPAEIQQAFYKLGLSFSVTTKQEISYVLLSGLDRYFEEGVALLEHILAYAKANPTALKNLLEDLKKNRLDEQKDKQQILHKGMMHYAYYGDNSPLKARFPIADFDKIQDEELLLKLKSLTSYEHTIFYYGSQTIDAVKQVLNKKHQVPNQLKPLLPKRTFTQLETKKTKVVLVHQQGMLQAEILMLSKGTACFDAEEDAISKLYNEYFGAGLSSIVFQEIRESRALAYSASVYNLAPAEKENAHYLRAYVGTQFDKIQEAIFALTDLIENMPIAADQMMLAIDGLLKKIESERITGSSIYWSKKANERRGLLEDIRGAIYQQYQQMISSEKNAIQTLNNFHQNKIQGRKFTILVLGDKEKLDMVYLQSLGELVELSLEDVF